MEKSDALHPSKPEDHKWEKIAVFAFGVVFITALLIISLFKELNAQAYTTIRIIMALAVAGVGVCIPGFLDVQLKGFVRAGGAMALFVIVYFFSPAPPAPVPGPDNVVIPPPPQYDPTITVEKWFSLIDAGDYASAWSQSSAASKNAYPLSIFTTLFKNQRMPLGNVTNRQLAAASQTTIYNGRHGNFRLFTYVTTFESGQRLREFVLVEGEDRSWKVFEHSLAP